MLSSDNDNPTININSLLCDADQLIPDLPLDFKSDTTRDCEDVHNEGVLSCKHRYCDEYHDEGKGFELTNKIVQGVSNTLPIYIPIPTQDVKYLPLTLSSSHLGVRLNDLYPNARHKKHNVWGYQSGTTPDMKFTTSPVYSSAQKILFYSGPDFLIEGINRDKYNFPIYDQIKSAGITTSTTPDFSVNSNSCTYGQVVNTNRTLAVGEEMSHRGISAIPNVFAVHPYLLNMWIQFLKVNKLEVPVISINCQCQRRVPKDMENLIWYINELAIATGVHIILHGYPIQNKEYLEAIKAVACQIHFADSGAFCDVTRGRKFKTYDAIKQEFTEETLVTNDPHQRVMMIESGIKAREQYLRDVFYSNMTCDYRSFTNLSVEVH